MYSKLLKSEQYFFHAGKGLPTTGFLGKLEKHPFETLPVGLWSMEMVTEAGRLKLKSMSPSVQLSADTMGLRKFEIANLSACFVANALKRFKGHAFSTLKASLPVTADLRENLMQQINASASEYFVDIEGFARPPANVNGRSSYVLVLVDSGRSTADDALIVGLAESLQARYEHKPKDADLVESIADLFNSFQGMDHGCSGTHCRPAR